jgi:hypothetical protein
MMSNKPERFYKFHVHFEPIFEPGGEIGNIRDIELDVYAKSVDDAIATAWKTVTVSPEEFRIIGVAEDGLFTKAYRFRND